MSSPRGEFYLEVDADGDKLWATGGAGWHLHHPYGFENLKIVL
jgi:hypothetical protein